MCGRLSCHLCRNDYKKAASYFDESSKKFKQPEWLETDNCGLQFKPSTNIAPTDITPVLVSGDHYNKPQKRLLQPMMWSLIPPWSKDYKNHGLSTNNCRIEGMSTSRLYSKPLKLGQRCVIVCEGFYEWEKTPGKGPKQPYFIHAPQLSGLQVSETKSWSSGNWDEQKGWEGPRLLMLAGVYDIWTSPDADQIFSYSVITMDSSKTLSWLHERMPAVIETEDMVEAWLDYKNVSLKEAIAVLQPAESLAWYPVSSVVNNSRNKSADCLKPIDVKKPKPINKIMASWLSKTAEPKNDLDAGISTLKCEENCGTKRDKKSTAIDEEASIQKKFKSDDSE